MAVTNVAERMRGRLFGQNEAVDCIQEQIDILESGLGEEDRPAGIFMLYGPTGSGKTKTVEVLAEILHGSRKKFLRIDCGEMQADHEVSKLIGAPPGYLGHRETQPFLTQAKLSGVTSEDCVYSILLLDEIEKASAALRRLLLGILDKAALRLGDSMTVNFEKTLIFMTSNLGLKVSAETVNIHEDLGSLKQIPGLELALQPTLTADEARRMFTRFFSAEFVNRIDYIIGYGQLTRVEVGQIIDVEVDNLQGRIVNSLGVTDDEPPRPKSFVIELTAEARDKLIEEANVPEWGGRHVRRIIRRRLTIPLARLIVAETYPPGAKLMIVPSESGFDFKKEKATTADLLRASVVTAEWRKRK